MVSGQHRQTLEKENNNFLREPQTLRSINNMTRVYQHFSPSDFSTVPWN